MNRFRVRELRAHNYRCFDDLTLPIEDDATVLFAENGGGKTALLAALAMGLAVFQRGAPKAARFNVARDVRLRTLDERGRREPVGPCELTWTADVGEAESVTWSTTARPGSGRTTDRHRPILEALEQVRAPGEPWPLFAWYGVDRLGRQRDRRRNVERTGDRWEAYESSLDPDLDEAPLLQWLQDEMLGDVGRQRGENRSASSTRPCWRRRSEQAPASRAPGTTQRRVIPWCASRTGTPPRGRSSPTATMRSSPWSPTSPAAR